MINDNNVKIIQYEGEFKIIKSFDNIGLHDICLISDKFAVLKGLTYPEYFTWLLDMEKLEIIKKWQTPGNDFFLYSLGENKFFTGNEDYLFISEIKEKDGDIIMNEITKTDIKEFAYIDFFQILNERTFAAITYEKYDYSKGMNYEPNSYLVVYECLCEYEND